MYVLFDEFRNFGSILILELIFALPGLRRKPRFGLRLGCCTVAGFAVSALYVLVHVYLQNPASYGAIVVISVLWYVGILALASLIIWFCFDIDLTELVWIALTAYAAQHMAYVIVGEIVYLGILRASIGTGAFLALYALVAAGIDVAVSLIFRPSIKGRERLYVTDTGKNLALLCVVLGVFLASTFANQYNTVGSFMQSFNYISAISDLFNCVFVLAVQYMSIQVSRINTEKERVTAMLETETRQYESFRNTVDYINIKCHDLKKEIAAMRQDGRVDEDYIDEVMEKVAVYESFVQTGNETLDSLLTDRNLQCISCGISFSCMADAAGLAGMKPRDIYVLFGNLLDNAIEYVKTLGSAENRVIRLFIRRRGNMIVIHQENTLNGTLRMEDGLPMTTKDDNTYHGFGMKSMRRIVQKYGGSLLVDPGDGLFRVEILLPETR